METVPNWKKKSEKLPYNVKKFSDVISKFITKLEKRNDIKANKVFMMWKEVAGISFRDNTKPLRIQDNILYVKTEAPVISDSLRFMKEDIIKKINDKLKQNYIKDIRFTQTK